MTHTENTITPTKESPIFRADCDHFGFIEDSPYLRHTVQCKDHSSSCATFALSYSDAINRLHEWLIENKKYVLSEPKAKFNIYIVDGSINKELDQAKEVKVYTISSAKAKKYLF